MWLINNDRGAVVLDWLLRALLGDGGDPFDWSGFFFFLLSLLSFSLALWALSKARRWALEAERWAMRAEESARAAARSSGRSEDS